MFDDAHLSPPVAPPAIWTAPQCDPPWKLVDPFTGIDYPLPVGITTPEDVVRFYSIKLGS